MYNCESTYMLRTVNGGRFAGLNIHGFSTMKFFMGILLLCFGQWCLLFMYSQENFHGTP